MSVWRNMSWLRLLRNSVCIVLQACALKRKVLYVQMCGVREREGGVPVCVKQAFQPHASSVLLLADVMERSIRLGVAGNHREWRLELTAISHAALVHRDHLFKHNMLTVSSGPSPAIWSRTLWPMIHLFFLFFYWEKPQFTGNCMFNRVYRFVCRKDSRGCFTQNKTLLSQTKWIALINYARLVVHKYLIRAETGFVSTLKKPMCLVFFGSKLCSIVTCWKMGSKGVKLVLIEVLLWHKQ